jgi:DNA-binding IclR family transcriptional regulator
MTDLHKARKIVTQRWISQPEALKENIAKAVAEGIALGRKEGLEMAANERWVNEHEALKENVAKAVAEGIALGRKEGFEMALKTIGEGINRLAKPPSK